MKKLVLLFSFLFIMSWSALACHWSPMTFVSAVDNCDGTYDITVNVCIGVVDNWGGTIDFTLEALGGSFTSYSALATNTLTSNYNVRGVWGVDCGYMPSPPWPPLTVGCAGGTPTVAVTATADGAFAGNVITFTETGSVPPGYNFMPADLDNCTMCAANPMNLCWDITFITNGYPAQMLFNGTEYDVGLEIGGGPGSCPSTVNLPCLAPTIITSSVDIDCESNCVGTTTADVTCGVPPFTYSWNDLASQTTSTATAICDGNYTVTITDAIGCTYNDNATVTEPPLLTATSSGTDLLCFGDGTGSVSATPGGGTPEYSYLWDDGGAQTTQTATGLGFGNYNVLVTDVNGCTVNESVTITEPTAVNLSSSVGNLLCAGDANGTGDLTSVGGTPIYTYLWSNGATTEDISGLTANGYSVTVTDANGCTSVENITITEPALLTSTSAGTDLLCFGDGTGSVSATPGGGTPGYSYLWDDGGAQTTQTATGLGFGNYNVLVTDVNGCTVNESVTITEPTAVNLSSSVGNLLCAGDANGTGDLTSVGGTPIYTYLWSNGATTEDVNNLIANSYSVTVTDLNGCTSVENITITEPSAVNLTSTVVNLLCAGDANGTGDLIPAGGTPGYTYLWSNGVTTEDVNGLIANGYSVTVTDLNGCTSVENITITEPSAIVLGVTPVNASCGQTNGSATVNANGGVGSYTYLWNDGNAQTTATANNLGAGPYSVTVTDANGCISIIPANIIDAGAPTITLNDLTGVLCSGGSNGSADVTGSGSVGPYTYSWDDPGNQTTAIATGLAQGPYTVTVTDGSGCITSQLVTITEPAAVNLSSTVVNLLCAGDANGTGDLTPGGGTPGYTYLWSNGETTEDINSLTANGYSVTVTDANGCSSVENITITEPTAVNLASTVINLLCAGDANGTGDLTPGGGSPGYTYLWSNGATTEDVNGLIANGYSVTVTDLNGCTSVENITITEPSAIVLGVNPIDATCNQSNGSATVNANGGAGSYLYSWDDSNNQTTATANNLNAGPYNVTVTDANGCISTMATNVANAGAPAITVNSLTAILCNGGSNGSADVTANGSVGPYSYSWDDPGGQTTAIATGLAQGPYTVTVTDGNGCIATQLVTITQPAAINLSSSVINALCNADANGSGDLTASGGSPGYTYLWSNGATTEDVNGLTANGYSVTVTDLNGCTSIENIIITEPTPINLLSATTDVLCSGDLTGSGELTPAGGSPGYTFLWSNGATTEDVNGLAANGYNVTVTDLNGCISVENITITEPTAIVVGTNTVDAICNQNNGSATANVNGGAGSYSYIWDDGNAQTTATASNLNAGPYNVTVTDANGCSVIMTANVIDSGSPDLTLNGITNVLCNGGSDGGADVTANNGTGPYTYLWDDPNAQTTSTATGLAQGNYSVTVIDVNGCTASQLIIVTEPLAIAINTTPFDGTCGDDNGSASTAVAGGVPGYNYRWNDANTQTTATAINLPAGIYQVKVTDDNGCTDSMNVTVGNIPAPVVTITGTPLLCKDDNSGTSTALPVGGTPPYDYLWNDPNGQAIQTAGGLAAGNYSVLVTDANGCDTTLSVIITEPDDILSSSGLLDAICESATGEASINSTGGTAPLTYLWDNGQTNATATNLTSGDYSVVVTDANGCTSMEVVSVSSLNVPPITNAWPDTSIMEGESVDIQASGGTQYIWFPANDLNNPASQNPTATPSQTTTYFVSITDQNGCKGLNSVLIIVEKPPYSLFIPNAFTPNNDAKNSLFVLQGEGIKEFEIRIFDRWGALIFTSTSLNSSWDGKAFDKRDVQEDTYVYYVTARDPDNIAHHYTGNVNVVR